MLNQILDSTRKQNQLLEKQMNLLHQYFDLDVDTDEDDEDWWNGEVDSTKAGEFIKKSAGNPTVLTVGFLAVFI